MTPYCIVDVQTGKIIYIADSWDACFEFLIAVKLIGQHSIEPYEEALIWHGTQSETR